MANQNEPKPMQEPRKPHGDKINPDKNAQKKSTGGAGEPQSSPLEPEKQGGISGP
ncbi:MAG: hypothetical protein ACJ8F3_16180 [Xanthobacteraceae bacterium]